MLVLQRVCDKHNPQYYPKFKQWADEYFYCKHRDQRRGLGGIFFDDLNDRPQDEVFPLPCALRTTCATLEHLPLCQHLSRKPWLESVSCRGTAGLELS